MFYVLEICASLLFALQFCATKYYQKHTDANFTSAIVFSVFTTALGFIPFFIYNGFKLQTTPFTLIVASIIGIINTVSTVNSIRILKYGKMSIYSLFMMLGSMILPYFFGIIWLSEDLTDLKIIGVILLAFSLILSAKDKNDDGKKYTIGFILLCALAFMLNGLGSICQSVQSHASLWNHDATELIDFIIWTRLTTIVFSMIAFLAVFLKPKETRKAELKSVKKIFKPKPLIGAVAYMCTSLSGFLLQIISVDHLPTSVLFPLSTGVTIVASTIIGRIVYKEKITKFMAFCLIITAVSTLLFMFGDPTMFSWTPTFIKNLFA